MADFFIRRPIVAMVIAILTVIVGLVSLKRLPIAEYPPVSPTMIQVTTTYRGAAAEAVMESVATSSPRSTAWTSSSTCSRSTPMTAS
jgi:HAE1 family hydrophobic/amphiphilic exporter-1